jgi:hypothetical protein
MVFVIRVFSGLFMLAALCTQAAAQMVATDPATRAFEEGRWADAIAAYRELVSAVEAQDDEEIWLGLTFPAHCPGRA